MKTRWWKFKMTESVSFQTECMLLQSVCLYMFASVCDCSESVCLHQSVCQFRQNTCFHQAMCLFSDNFYLQQSLCQFRESVCISLSVIFEEVHVCLIWEPFRETTCFVSVVCKCSLWVSDVYVKSDYYVIYSSVF